MGAVRIGIAASDPDGVLAFPVQTLVRDPGAGQDPTPGERARLAELIEQYAAIEVVVGLPRSLDGGEGPAAARARRYARGIATHIAPRPVRLVDERLTTVDAHRNLAASGVAGRAQRGLVDQAAAVLILQAALEAERASGTPPGAPAIASGRKPRRKGTRT